jgi:hypothetical protein
MKEDKIILFLKRYCIILRQTKKTGRINTGYLHAETFTVWNPTGVFLERLSTSAWNIFPPTSDFVDDILKSVPGLSGILNSSLTSFDYVATRQYAYNLFPLHVNLSFHYGCKPFISTFVDLIFIFSLPFMSFFSLNTILLSPLNIFRTYSGMP